MKTPNRESPRKKEASIVLNSAFFAYRDAVTFLELSGQRKRLTKVLHLKESGVYARASILLFHSTIEAFLNYLLYVVAFPDMSETLKKEIERMPYKNKLQEITFHASEKKFLIKNDEKLYRSLLELAELRNSFIHPKNLRYSGHASGRKNILQIEIRNPAFGETYPISGLKKNFLMLSYNDAIKARKMVDRFITKLKKYHLIRGTFQITSDGGSQLFTGKPPQGVKINVRGRGEVLIDFLEYMRRAKDIFY
jgi:hypothetical protein